MTDQVNTSTALYNLGEALRAGDLDAARKAQQDAWDAYRRFEERVNDLIRVAEAGGGAPVLDAQEREAMDHIAAAMHTIVSEWGLRANHDELTAAVHVLQGFIVQHMLSRLAPGAWNTWYSDHLAKRSGLCGVRRSPEGMRGWYTCTLSPGHDGHHEAGGSLVGLHPVTWPQEEHA